MKKIVFFVTFALLLCVWSTAQADFYDNDETGYYTIYCSGEILTYVGGSVYTDDEYISGDNGHYRITSVDSQNLTAQAEYLGQEAFSRTDESALLVNSQSKDKLIGMYCTHSDESYEKGDGKSSDEQWGGIYDVATELKSQLESQGIKVDLDYATHFPHDSGAYTRSRSTAISLLKQMPDALLDVHRDGGVPPEQYRTEIEGDKITKVRLFVGKRNQNSSANKNLAKTIKATADEMFPGFIKDIYMGKGNYNQELAPNSILLEFGTNGSNKEEVLGSTKYMAQVLSQAIYGTSGTGGGNESANNQRGAATAAPQTTPIVQQSKGAWSGIGWVLGIVVGGGLLFLLLTKGGRRFGSKVGRSVSELTGGLFGKKPEKKE